MSEYQYYEFRAIDKPLTDKQRAKVAELSSRAQVTSQQATFVYNYGDFRGHPGNVLEKYFDIMMYVANWGNRQLLIRIPANLINMKQVAPFCISEEIDHWKANKDRDVVLDLNFCEEENYEWIEGESWLDDLLRIRDELIQGDFRVLYLAWLKAASLALDREDIEDHEWEPPIPRGLKKLTTAQKAYVKFIDLDEKLVEAAALESEPRTTAKLDIEYWVAQLKPSEQQDFLCRLSRGEANLSTLLNQRLRELASSSQSPENPSTPPSRMLGELLELVKTVKAKQKEVDRKQAARAHQLRMEALAEKQGDVWEQVDTLIKKKNTEAYRQATKLLKDLRDLAEYQGDQEYFQEQVEAIQTQYSRLSALNRYIKEAGLID